jgi:cell division protein ZapA (FtsZ GTPase activity inhibitor)
MTKEETIYEIKKLKAKYTKLRANCNEEWNRLDEATEDAYEDQMMLVAEQEAYLTMIADLDDLLKEIV